TRAIARAARLAPPLPSARAMTIHRRPRILLWLLAAALAPGAARADVAQPLNVNGTLTIQAGSGTTQMFTNGLVQSGSTPLVISGSVLIRGGKGNGSTCSYGGECWSTDYCEDGVCCCNSPVNGTCYQAQYANNIYGNNNDPGAQFQCGNCAACNKTGNGTCAATTLARSAGRVAGQSCRPPALAADGSTCDVPEYCSCDASTQNCAASTQQCPADLYGGPSTMFAFGVAGQCRASRGSCDVPGMCPGGTTPSAAVCPPNQARLPNSYVCA